MKFEPLVSVIMPCYNASKFIPMTIESLVAQVDAPPYELIVCDDASNDGTLEILQNYAKTYSWIKILRQPVNQGPVQARNRCISVARGRFIAFLDADDLWKPDKLNKQIAFMQETNCAISYTDYRHASEDLSRVGCRVSPPSKIGYLAYLVTRYIGCLTVVIDRQIVKNFEFEYLAPARRGEDYLAWGRVIADYGPARLCPHDLAIYRIVRNSRSYGKINSSKSIWYLYRNNFRLNRATATFVFSCYVLFALIKHTICAPIFKIRELQHSS